MRRSVREGLTRRNMLRSIAITGLSLAIWLALAPSLRRVKGAQTTSLWQAQGAQTTSEFDRIVDPFLARTCYSCHNAKVMSGGVNLEVIRTADSSDAGGKRSIPQTASISQT